MIILILAFFASAVLNLDSITIATKLSENSTLREAVVTQAQEIANNPEIVTSPQTSGNNGANESELTKRIKDIKTEIDKLGLPIGWENPDPPQENLTRAQGVWKWILRIIGWSATAFAVSLGAPFWFDLLNRFIKVRSSIKSPEPDKPIEAKPNGSEEQGGN